MNTQVEASPTDALTASVAASPGLPFTFAQQYRVLLDAADDGSPVVCLLYTSDAADE